MSETISKENKKSLEVKNKFKNARKMFFYFCSYSGKGYFFNGIFQFYKYLHITQEIHPNFQIIYFCSKMGLQFFCTKL